jgi:Septum formation initiator
MRVRRRRRLRLRRWLPVAALVLLAFLYYKPVRAYFDARGALAQRALDVRRLRAEERGLRRRLAATASDETLLREARRLGYVKAGERLFIIDGIEAWQRRHTLRASNRSTRR